VFMPREIIITSTGVSESWSRQWSRRTAWSVPLGNSLGRTVAAQSRGIEIIRNDTRSGVVAAFQSAARAAGRGGKILYSHGHGNGVRDGANIQFTESRAFVVNSMDIPQQLRAQHATITVPGDNDFNRIGSILQQHGIREVVFLVCGLGANPDFMRLVKAGWGGGIQVSAYADGVSLQSDTSPVTYAGSNGQNNNPSTYPRVRLYLWRDGADPTNPQAYGTGTSAVPLSWLEIPAGLVTI
jgi:hypothetical protein